MLCKVRSFTIKLSISLHCVIQMVNTQSHNVSVQHRVCDYGNLIFEMAIFRKFTDFHKGQSLQKTAKVIAVDIIILTPNS